MRIDERVYLVGSGNLGFNLTDDYDCHVYLVDGGSEMALIDSGGGHSVSAILKNIQSAGLDLGKLKFVLLTHAHLDHSGGASELHEHLNLQVGLSHVRAEALRKGDEQAISLDLARAAGLYTERHRLKACPVDIELREGMEIKVGECLLRCIETPGHSDDLISFQMTSSNQSYLFCGDTLFHGGKLVLLNSHDCSLQKALASIRRLKGIEFDAFLPGHFCFSVRNGKRHVEAAWSVMQKLSVPPSAI
jgi:glyoxylase-like metal-dependent hydrolase (beta-lactamase superfamily II)